MKGTFKKTVKKKIYVKDLYQEALKRAPASPYLHFFRVSGAQKVLRLINTLRIQLITCWGVSLWEELDDLQDDPHDDPQDDPAGISRVAETY